MAKVCLSTFRGLPKFIYFFARSVGEVAGKTLKMWAEYDEPNQRYFASERKLCERTVAF
jgi:hypothetical protein